MLVVVASDYDTVWIGEFETACDAIELLLGPTASDEGKP
jgi:nitroreductase